MRIAVLSRKKELYSTRRLLEAGKARGHQVQMLDSLKVYMNIMSAKPSIHYHGEKLEPFDAVIPRIGASITFYGLAVVRQFEMMGIYSINESQAISRARDKLRSLQLLSREGIDLPITAFGHALDDTQDLINMVGKPPLVIKLLEGTQGMGVVLAETKKAAESVIDAFRNLDIYFLIQEYIEEAQGTDIRCLVVGQEVIASMKRTAKAGEFRSNLHRGGSAELVEVTEQERQMAIDASNALGLNLAGVDIMRSRRGPLVIEVNSSPGLEGIEKSTGVDVASKIIEFIEQNAAPHKTKTRGQG